MGTLRNTVSGKENFKIVAFQHGCHFSSVPIINSKGVFHLCIIVFSNSIKEVSQNA